MERRRYFFAAVLLLAGVLALSAEAATPEEWQSRTIYQIMTDRFAGPSPSTPCSNLNDYCGGTYQGLIEHLDYITGMGFDAIWISPVIENTPGGYHGYWAKDFYKTNPHFGTEEDLVAFVKAAHARDVWVMVDVVANHVGPVGTDFSGITPFSTSQSYHPECAVTEYTCFQEETLHCRLESLPDLDQQNTTVSDELTSWISKLITTYDFDGVRADTVMYINQDFWVDFNDAAGVYMVGEVWSDLDCSVAYQQKGVDGVLAYPLYYVLGETFGGGQSLLQLQAYLKAAQAYPNAGFNGNFVDNQDNPRFLYTYPDRYAGYTNALVYLLFGEGIPIVYYGTAQLFDGGPNPANREIFWPTGYATNTWAYAFLQETIGWRVKLQPWAHPQVQRYANDEFYAFTRGTTFVALTNTHASFDITITYHPYADGTNLCNVFALKTDCVVVENGAFQVSMGAGEPKVLIPQPTQSP